MIIIAFEIYFLLMDVCWHPLTSMKIYAYPGTINIQSSLAFKVAEHSSPLP